MSRADNAPIITNGIKKYDCNSLGSNSENSMLTTNVRTTIIQDMRYLRFSDRLYVELEANVVLNVIDGIISFYWHRWHRRVGSEGVRLLMPIRDSDIE